MNGSPIIRVVIVDDHSILRASLCRLLDAQEGIEVVAEIGSTTDLCLGMDGLRAVLFILGCHVPGYDPTGDILQILNHDPDASVLVLTAFEKDSTLSLILNSGAVGTLPLTIEPESLFDALRRVARGETLYTRSQLARARRWCEEIEKLWLSLTERERSTAICLARGLDNQQIAGEFGVSLRTVETYVTHAMGKLHVNSRLEAAVWIRDHLPEVWWRYADQATA